MQSKMKFYLLANYFAKIKNKVEMWKEMTQNEQTMYFCTFNTEKILNSYFTNEEAANVTLCAV